MTRRSWRGRKTSEADWCGKDGGKKDEHAKRAVELLQRAVQAGYKDAEHMKQDTDLDPLRGRDDFKKLLQSLSPPKDPAPPREG